MAFKEKGSSGIIYTRLMQGKIVKEVKEGDPDWNSAKEKEIENPSTGTKRTARFLEWSCFEGILTKVFIKPPDENVPDSRLCLVLDDGSEKVQIEMKASSKYASAFFKCMPNIQPQYPLEVSPSIRKGKEGKSEVGLFLSHNIGGKMVPIKWYWTKENPGDVPKWEQIKVKGQLVWDNSKELEYLIEYMEKELAPTLKGYVPESSDNPDDHSIRNSEDTRPDDDDVDFDDSGAPDDGALPF